MIAEALVIFACVNSSGCQETSSLYFSQHPDVREMIEKKAMKAKDLIGPKFVDTVGPFLFVAAGGTGVVKFDKYFSMSLKKDSGTLLFTLNLPE